MIFRIIYFVGIFILSVFITPLISAPVAFVYAMRWYAPELILIGFAIDAYFGPMYDWPYYTAAAFLIVVAALIAKRYLMLK